MAFRSTTSSRQICAWRRSSARVRGPAAALAGAAVTGILAKSWEARPRNVHHPRSGSGQAIHAFSTAVPATEVLLKIETILNVNPYPLPKPFSNVPQMVKVDWEAYKLDVLHGGILICTVQVYLSHWPLHGRVQAWQC